jgi:hypothetical protein
VRKVFALFLLPFLLAATPPEKPVGKFLRSTVKLGEPVKFALVYKHQPELEVVFPDSGYRFAPFEYIKKESYPTKTVGNISTDSAIFILRTFELDLVQKLQLPVFILERQDTVSVFGNEATIKLQEVIQTIPEPPVFKENTEIETIEKRFNYPYLILGLIGVLILFGTLWFIFRKRILTRYRLYILEKKHTAFISRYNVFIDRFHKSVSLENMEKAIILWKNYLTDLEDHAINSFTTKEIVNYYENDEDVTTALKLFDRAIYGNILSDKTSDTLTAFYLLHHFADRRYDLIKEQTRNATTAR